MSNKINHKEWCEKIGADNCEHDTKCADCRASWNFCESQYKAEVEGLKTKFSEATKTYTDDIDKLEKENESLKKKLETCQECDYDNCKGCKLFEGE